MSLISVIIPVYNGERYLGEAIQSVPTQTYEPVELIVIDDGSTDRSADVAKGFSNVRYELQENRGISAARNRGVEVARGEFLAFLDADDVWISDKLSLQMAAVERDPTLNLVFGHVKEFVSPELVELLKGQVQVADGIVPGLIPSTLLVRREAFVRMGVFETNWKMGEFAAWYTRAIEHKLNQIMLPNLVARRRVHDANNGRRQRESATDYVRILKASLDRRRMASTADAEPDHGHS
jgi:glycosyltransferase involved in cell wall biosynthesis